jgi:hypothetical protein
MAQERFRRKRSAPSKTRPVDYTGITRSQSGILRGFQGLMRTSEDVIKASKQELEIRSKKEAAADAATYWETEITRYPELGDDGERHPQAGQVIAPEFGESPSIHNIYQESLQAAVMGKYFVDVKSGLDEEIKRLRLEHNKIDQLPDPIGFRTNTEAYLKGLIKTADPRIRTDLMDYGYRLVNQHDNALQDELTRIQVGHAKVAHDKAWDIAVINLQNITHAKGYDTTDKDVAAAAKNVADVSKTGYLHYGPSAMALRLKEVETDNHVGFLFNQFKKIEAGKDVTGVQHSRAYWRDVFLESIQDYSLDSQDPILRGMDPKRRAGMIVVMKKLIETDEMVEQQVIKDEVNVINAVLGRENYAKLNTVDRKIIDDMGSALDDAYGGDDSTNRVTTKYLFDLTVRLLSRREQIIRSGRQDQRWDDDLEAKRIKNETDFDFMNRMAGLFTRDETNKGVRDFGNYLKMQIAGNMANRDLKQKMSWTNLRKKVETMRGYFKAISTETKQKEINKHTREMTKFMMSFMPEETREAHQRLLLEQGEIIEIAPEHGGGFDITDPSAEGLRRRSDIMSTVIRGKQEKYAQKMKLRTEENYKLSEAIKLGNRTVITARLRDMIPQIDQMMDEEAALSLQDLINTELTNMEPGGLGDSKFGTPKALAQYVQDKIKEVSRVESWQTDEQRSRLAKEKLIRGYELLGQGDTGRSLIETYAESTKNPGDFLKIINAEYAKISSQVTAAEATERRLATLKLRISSRTLADPNKNVGSDIALITAQKGINPFDLARMQNEGILNAGIHQDHVEVMKGVLDFTKPEKVAAAVKLYQHYTNKQNSMKSMSHLRAQLSERVNDTLRFAADVSGGGDFIDPAILEGIEDKVRQVTGVDKAYHENLGLLPGIDPAILQTSGYDGLNVARGIFDDLFGKGDRPNKLFWSIMDVTSGTGLTKSPGEYRANFPNGFKRAVILRAITRLHKYTGTTDPTLFGGIIGDDVKTTNFKKALTEAVNALTTKHGTGEGTWGWSSIMGGQPGQYRATHYMMKNPPNLYFALDSWSNRTTNDGTVPDELQEQSDAITFNEMEYNKSYPGSHDSPSHRIDWMAPFAEKFIAENGMFKKGTDKSKLNFTEGFGQYKDKTLSLQYHSMNTTSDPPTPLYTVTIIERNTMGQDTVPVIDTPYVHDKATGKPLIIDFKPEMIRRNAEEDLRFTHFKAIQHLSLMERRKMLKEWAKTQPSAGGPAMFPGIKQGIAEANK